MNRYWIVSALCLFLWGSTGAQAAGCVSGAVAGGVVGHVAGHHGLIGAAVGCAIGHHEAAVKQKQANQADRANQNNVH